VNAAERLIAELGITSPEEIDLEDIAFLMGVEVQYCPLDGCEARIIGNEAGTEAIATINCRSSWERQRYSLGHELGHWHHHRGKLLFCHSEDIGNAAKAVQFERDADRFAADLLMPRQIFDPILAKHGKINFKTIRALADDFQTSLTATAIRVAESRRVHAVLACYNRDGRRWFTRSPGVPSRWFPSSTVDRETPAYGLLFQGETDSALPMRIPADAWFDCYDAKYYDIREQSVRISADEILTILLFDNDRMLEER